MPQFILDESGVVDGGRTFKNLDAFARGYIECLFFTETATGVTPEEWDSDETQADISAGRVDGSIPSGLSFGDLSPGALDSILTDCAAFREKGAPLLAEAYSRDYCEEQAGRDFWFTRNGHGVGFWDREALEPRGEEYESLTSAMVAASKAGDNAAWAAACAKRSALKDKSLGARLTELAQTFGERYASFNAGAVYLD